MDRVDREILSLLQTDGRLSLTELARSVRISLSSCHRRLRALEASGVISGYRAQIDPKAIGLGFDALVFITMDSTARETVEAFERTITTVPNVIQTQRLFGDPDFLLHVVAPDMPAFQELYDERLSTLPGVRRLTSTLVMKNVIPGHPLPI